MTNGSKITKRMRFEELKTLAAAAHNDELVEFVDAQIEALDKRAEKAKEYKAKKAKASDGLTDKIYGALTTEFQNADQITEAVAEGNEEITRAKVVARLSALVRNGLAEKTTQKIEKRRITTYAKVTN